MIAADNTPTSAPIKKAPKRKKILLAIGSVFALIGIAILAEWVLVGRFSEDTENAYVQGNVVQITPQIAGTVSKIYVDDTNVVKPGQPLVSLDPADADIALAQADAQLAQTVREVRTLYTNQLQAQANLTLRQSDLGRATEDMNRRKALAGSGAVSAEEIRHAENAVTAAQAAVSIAQEQLASGRALTEGTNVEQHPNVLRAAARVQEVLLAQKRTTLFAPVGGEVAKRNVQVGQRINPGAPLMAIVPLDQMWVDANFKESQLGKIRVGQTATLVADLYGSKVQYKGKVVGMAAGTGSAFALLPAQNATGNWIKVVQRVPVRIALDQKQLSEHPLRVGLSMQVEIDLHDQSGAAVGENLSKAVVMSAFNSPSAPADVKTKARIDAIIAANLK
jgi:membrane fusion protein (multidrug efflux system)